MPAINWCPPELLTPKGIKDYTTASDIFSLVMVFSEILIKEPPLDELSTNVSHSDWYRIIAEHGIRPKLPLNTLSEVRAVIESGWSTDSQLRPTAATIAAVIGK